MSLFRPGKKISAGDLSQVENDARLARRVRLGPGLRGYGSTEGGSSFSSTDFGSLIAEVRYPVVFAAWAVATVYVSGDVVVQSGLNYRCILKHTAAAGNSPTGGGLGVQWLKLATCYNCYLIDPTTDRNGTHLSDDVSVWCDDGDFPLPAGFLSLAYRSRYGEWFMRDTRERTWYWFDAQTYEGYGGINDTKSYDMMPVHDDRSSLGADVGRGFAERPEGNAVVITAQMTEGSIIGGSISFTVQTGLQADYRADGAIGAWTVSGLWTRLSAGINSLRADAAVPGVPVPGGGVLGVLLETQAMQRTYDGSHVIAGVLVLEKNPVWA